MKIIIILSIFVLSQAYPTAIFHGFGDYCSQSGMASFTEKIGDLIHDYTVCIEIGSGFASSIGMDFHE